MKLIVCGILEWHISAWQVNIDAFSQFHSYQTTVIAAAHSRALKNIASWLTLNMADRFDVGYSVIDNKKEHSTVFNRWKWKKAN